MHLSLASLLSIISLLVSIAVAWLTLLRRGTLGMTQPVQIAFLYENKQKPKVFLRTLLYATGKRGYVIEALFIKVRHKNHKQGESIQTLALWAFGEREALTIAGGLRVTEQGIAHNHHFMTVKDHWYFADGNYEVLVFARIVNRKRPKLLCRIKLELDEAYATRLYLRQGGVLFTRNPDSGSYDLSPVLENKERPLFGIV